VWATLPHPTSRVVIGATAGAGHVNIRVRSDEATGDRLETTPPNALQQTFATFALPRPSQRIAISADAPCELVFVGYED